MDFFTDICINNSEKFKNDFQKIPYISDKALVIVEPRKHKSLEFVINNFVHFCPGWSLYIFHSKLNSQFVKDIIKGSKNIHCIELFEDNINQQIYNDLLLTKDFWNLIESEKILIFQCDTMIRNFEIDKYLEYDYIGAPWITQERLEKANMLIDIRDRYLPDKHHFMNGGLSLRSKSIMLKCLEFLDIDRLRSAIEDLPFDKKEMARDILWEDVFFLHGCKLLNAKLPNLEVAINFSSEHIMNTNSLGFHKIWDNNKTHPLKNILEIMSIKSLDIVPKKANYFIRSKNLDNFNYAKSSIENYMKKFNLDLEVYRIDDFEELVDIYSILHLNRACNTNPEKAIWKLDNLNEINYLIDYFCRFYCWNIEL